MEDVIRIEGVYYSTEGLSKIHPGGDIMVLICNRQDGTAIFNSSHRRAFPHAKYAQYAIPEEKVKKEVRLPPNTQDFSLYFKLCELIRPVIAETGGFAPWTYFAKVFLIMAVVLLADLYSVFGQRPLWATAIQSLFFGLVGLNLQHDANHGAVSKNPTINRWIGLAQDYIGGSSLSWMTFHDTIHHVHCNDVERDADLEIPLLRLKHAIPYKAHYALQQLYFVALESCFGPLHVFQTMLWTWTGAASDPRLKLLCDKYLATSKLMSFLTPLRLIFFWIHSDSWAYVATTFFVQYSIGGLYLAFFFLMSHNFDGVRKEGVNTTKDDFVRNQSETSSNVGGWLLAISNGGLNYQIEHHLFPRVHHSYYHRMAPIVREFCRKHGIQYTHFATIQDNFSSTFDHLAKLGRDPKKG